MWQRVGRHARRLKDLRRRLRRRPKGQLIAHGRRLVADLLARDLSLEELWVTPALVESMESACHRATFAAVVDDSVFARVLPAASSQGLVAVFRVTEPEHGPDQLTAGLVTYLDGVQDPGNLGAILRSVAAFGHSRVWLGPQSADPYGMAALRASAGAAVVLSLRREVTVEALVATQAPLVVADGSGEPMETWVPVDREVLVFGTEGAGVDSRLLEAATRLLALPLHAGVESLNVAVSAGILLHHAMPK